MELIFHYSSLCNEIKGVLISDGIAYIWVPFLINAHRQPSDYFRYTDEALKKIFSQAGFNNVEVEAYGGLGIVIGTYIGQLAYKFKPVTSLIHFMSFGLDKAIQMIKKHDKVTNQWPLGYLVIASR